MVHSPFRRDLPPLQSRLARYHPILGSVSDPRCLMHACIVYPSEPISAMCPDSSCVPARREAETSGLGLWWAFVYFLPASLILAWFRNAYIRGRAAPIIVCRRKPVR